MTLGHDAIPKRIAYAREPRKLPVVLSADKGRYASSYRLGELLPTKKIGAVQRANVGSRNSHPRLSWN